MYYYLDHTKPLKHNESEKTFVRTKEYVWCQKIMWEEQLVDPPTHYLTCEIVP